MRKIRTIAVLTALATLTPSGVALAAKSKITGGTTQITISTSANNALTANHLTVTPLAPATSSGSTFTFPISRGRLNRTSLHGVILNRGGFAISNGTKTFRVRRPSIVSNKHGVSVWALVRTRHPARCAQLAKHHLGRHCDPALRFSVRRIARITGVHVSRGSATGTVRLTRASAPAINRLAGKAIAKAGIAIGTITVTPKFG
jgi:hypothetical protein